MFDNRRSLSLRYCGLDTSCSAPLIPPHRMVIAPVAVYVGPRAFLLPPVAQCSPANVSSVQHLWWSNVLFPLSTVVGCLNATFKGEESTSRMTRSEHGWPPYLRVTAYHRAPVKVFADVLMVLRGAGTPCRRAAISLEKSLLWRPPFTLADLGVVS
jgi:hypothetical protein